MTLPVPIKESDSSGVIGRLEGAADKELVRWSKDGDQSAYGELIRRYQERIYATVYNMISNHEDAADLVQEAFVKAWQSLKKFKGESSFYTWVYRIAVNRTLNHLKSPKNRRHMSLNDLDAGVENNKDLVALISHQTPRREAKLAELKEKLNEALQGLSEAHRAVVVMHDIQGIPHDEIAEILECKPATVRTRLYYARQQLQGLLADFLG
jgi:RNA polymerase sigma-70 factor (ECF subfamily)